MKTPAKTKNPTSSKKETSAQALPNPGSERGARPTNAIKTNSPEAVFLAAVLALQGVTVRRKGYWLWMDGSRRTYRNRQALRTAGARWDKNRRAWYWRPEFAKAATAEA